MPEIALVSREFHPLTPGGIGAYLNALAHLLAPLGQVTVFTSSLVEPTYRKLVASADARIPAEAQFVFVNDPSEDEAGDFYSRWHLYSARVYDAIVGFYSGAGPDLIEFADYLGEGAVTLQAKRTACPNLRRTKVAVRLHTSSFMCAILDGHLGTRHRLEFAYELERLSLRYADVLLTASDEILASYGRLYGSDALAPAATVRHPLRLDTVVSPGGEKAPPPVNGPLRLLYLGRFERRKGVHNLVRALSGIAGEGVELTLVGSDTDTGPVGTSMRTQLELMAGPDQRVTMLDAVPRSEVVELIQSHHALVVPSLWECWPNVALEAMLANRPIVATPVGGLVEMIGRRESGWLTRDSGVNAIEDAINGIMSDRDQVAALIESQAPRTVASELTDPAPIRRHYQELLEPGPRNRQAIRKPKPPLVSVVIPYFRLHEYIEAAVESIFEQSYSRIEVVIVNDGSFAWDDGVLGTLAAGYPLRVLTQVNQGLGAARNAGIVHTRGSYVLPMDADNIAEPQFVARAVAALEADPQLAYVTCWSRYIDELGRPLGSTAGYHPLGNFSHLIDRLNVAGDAAALLRRRIFDLGFSYSEEVHSYEDWVLYSQLRDARMFGMVIPEPLMRYRVRAGSMMREVGVPQEARLREQMAALAQERRNRWTFTNA